MFSRVFKSITTQIIFFAFCGLTMMQKLNRENCVCVSHVTFFLQLICTITPASSNTEETHNTLKFASRAKRVEINASRNKVCSSTDILFVK